MAEIFEIGCYIMLREGEKSDRLYSVLSFQLIVGENMWSKGGWEKCEILCFGVYFLMHLYSLHTVVSYYYDTFWVRVKYQNYNGLFLYSVYSYHALYKFKH